MLDLTFDRTDTKKNQSHADPITQVSSITCSISVARSVMTAATAAVDSGENWSASKATVTAADRTDSRWWAETTRPAGERGAGALTLRCCNIWHRAVQMSTSSRAGQTSSASSLLSRLRISPFKKAVVIPTDRCALQQPETAERHDENEQETSAGNDELTLLHRDNCQQLSDLHHKLVNHFLLKLFWVDELRLTLSSLSSFCCCYV